MSDTRKSANPGWRSLLFVPADDRRRLAKIASRGADAVILDLEDGVAPAGKSAARSSVAEHVEALTASGCQVVIRINGAWLDAVADLEVAVRAGVSAIMVPKVEGRARLEVLGQMVSEIAGNLGLSQGIPLIALIESPAGVAHLDDIIAAPGLIGLALGSEDLALSLGTPPARAMLELPCRLLALAAARRGQMALALPVSIATIRDEGSWSEGVAFARAVGATGALCVHPDQIRAVNAGFSPTPAEIVRAEGIRAAWQAGGGAVIQVAGEMIDLPVALSAERVLARAARIAGS